MHYFTRYQSPLGEMTLQANDKGLTGAWFEGHTTLPHDLGVESQDHPLLNQAILQFDEYFAGQRQQFSIATNAQGTDFQQQVWAKLSTIPFGETWSYQDMAEAIGNPKAVRAVGLANGKNPLSVIVPCHRVIGKNGQLTGYAGGLSRKQQLLSLES